MLAFSAVRRPVVRSQPKPQADNHPKSLWIEEAVDLLRSHFSSGLSARQSADKLNAQFPKALQKFTRLSVIGKRHRLGLKSWNAAPVKKKAKSAQRPKPQLVRAPEPETKPKPKFIPAPVRIARAPEPKPEPAPVVAAIERPASELVAIWDLESHHCHFPYGDPRDIHGFRYCGATALDGFSYCAGHRALMWRPAEKQEEHLKKMAAF